MKKKIVILTSASLLAVSGALAFGLVSNKKMSKLNVAQATDKEFTFSNHVGQEQFETSSNLVEKSVVTGISSNLETSVSLKDENGTEGNKVFGDSGYFVRNGASYGAPKITVEIGVNNVTSVTVISGMMWGSVTTATEAGCSIQCYSGNTYIDGYASCGDSYVNAEQVTSFTKDPEESRKIDKVVIEAYVPSGFVYYGEPLFIKSITLNWSC